MFLSTEIMMTTLFQLFSFELDLSLLPPAVGNICGGATFKHHARFFWNLFPISLQCLSALIAIENFISLVRAKIRSARNARRSKGCQLSKQRLSWYTPYGIRWTHKAAADCITAPLTAKEAMCRLRVCVGWSG